MSNHQILIVTESVDLHSDDMIHELRRQGHDPIRLNTEDIPLNTRHSFQLDEDGLRGQIHIQTNGRTIDIGAIRSIWWRRPNAFTLPEDLSEQELEFARGEIRHAMSGLWAMLDCYWVSFPAFIRQASWKLDQLRRAAQLGFDVPRTLITTDPEAARAFLERCQGRMIYKVMTDPMLALHKAIRPDAPAPPRPRAARTTLISLDNAALLESIRSAHCQFQEYIPKQVELRVTVIGDEVFAAAIHSQDHPKTSIDWRHYEIQIPYRKTSLPPEIAERCLQFVRSYRLNFSAIDLILTPDGRYVFLENNPNGQFMFVEKQVPELRMTAALAACLIRGANS
jgi:glutathione synthase/RimK-type ligase-like ATP-grasp enzyme